METLAITAGLLAAVFYGISPVVSKRGLSYGGTPITVAVIVVATGTVVLWGIHFALHGVGDFPPKLAPSGYAIFIIGGLVGTALGRISNYTGVDRVGASINTAVISTNPIFATVLALIFLGEYITVPQAFGVVIIAAGLVNLSFSGGGDISGWSKTDLLFPLFAAFAYGAGGVIRRYGLTETAATPIEGAALNETAALIAMVSFVVTRRRSVLDQLPFRALAYFVATGVVGSLGVLMLFVGLKNGPVAIVTVLSSISLLIAVALSYVLLDDLEHVTRKIVVSTVLIVVGVSLLTLG